MTEVNMERVVEILKGKGVNAYVEQTGGGCATIYAGEAREEPEYGKRYAAVAGPGWFTGPSWTEARGDTDDFYVGVDDYGDAMPAQPESGATDEQVADLIAAQVAKGDYPTCPKTEDEPEPLCPDCGEAPCHPRCLSGGGL